MSGFQVGKSLSTPPFFAPPSDLPVFTYFFPTPGPYLPRFNSVYISVIIAGEYHPLQLCIFLPGYIDSSHFRETEQKGGPQHYQDEKSKCLPGDILANECSDLCPVPFQTHLSNAVCRGSLLSDAIIPAISMTESGLSKTTVTWGASSRGYQGLPMS